MSNFTIHDPNTAPEPARKLLQEARSTLGFVPNMYGVMAASPSLLKGYKGLSELFAQTALTAVEQQIVLLTVSYENDCGYCMAAHSALAGKAGMSEPELGALRNGQPLSDPKHEALRRFTAQVVQSRGHPDADHVNDFLKAGYTRANLLDVVLGVGMKTLSNYTNHLAETPLDAAFQPLEWKKAS